MQKVYVGVTRSGIPSLFTNGYAAWQFTGLYPREIPSGPAAMRKYAKSLRFELVAAPDPVAERDFYYRFGGRDAWEATH